MQKRVSIRTWISTLAVMLAALCMAETVTLAQPGPGYLASTWSDQSVHFLSTQLDNLGSFSVGSTNPNGVTNNGSLIWTAHWTTSEVIAYDFNGVEQFRWNAPIPNAQGLEYINTSEIAVLDANGPSVEFYNPMTGAFVRDIPAISGLVEGLAWDGDILWQLESAFIYATDITNGNTLFTLPNAAAGAPFGGTGITSSGPDELTLAGVDGSWWKVSKADGGVLDSGFNDWDMYGLSFIIPEPASLCLLGFGAFVVLRRRRS